MRATLAVLLTGLTVSVAVAQPTPGPSRSATSPSSADSSSARMYIVQGALGIGLGALGALGGGSIGSAIAETRCENSEDWFCELEAAIYGVLGGYTLGVAVGVHAVGRGYPPSGSFGRTLLGSSLGTLAGIGFIGAVADSEHPELGFAAPLFPLAGAMLTYHASRNVQT